MLEVKHTVIEGDGKGRHVLITGAVHGDEPCGPLAIERILAEFEAGAHNLKAGKVTFVPTCNPKAYADNVRYVEDNLNRIVTPHKNPQTHEQHYANILCDYIQGADVLLDLHSFSVPGKPLIFLDHPTPAMSALADALDANLILYGWDNIYGDMPIKSITTETWAHRCNTEAMTYECGQNGSDISAENAYEAILRTLSFFDMLEAPVSLESTQALHLDMQSLQLKEREGAFTRTFKEVEFLAKGTHIATYADGEKLAMPHDGYIILPKPTTGLGEEWYYIGTKRLNK